MNNRYYYSSFIVLNLLLFVYFLELVFPPITTIGNSTLICALCLAFWLIISFMSNPDFYLESNIHTSYLLIFFAATIIVPYTFGIGTIGNRYLSLALLPVGPVIFRYYKEHEKLRDLKLIILGLIPFAGTTFFITLTRLIKSPYISRSIKSSGEHSQSLARQGIGGYSFIYFMVVVCILLLYIFLKTRKKTLKFLNASGFAIGLFFLLKSNYVTALLVALLASAVLFVMHYANSDTGNMPALILSVIGVFLIIANLNTIIDTFSEYIPARIAEVLVVEDGKNIFQSVTDEFLGDRWPTMRLSIQSFLKNPILGLLGTQNLSVVNGFYSGFGQHSHILDTFSLLGIIFGLINIFVILRPFKDDDGIWIKHCKPLNVAMLICLTGIYLFNNATASIGLAFTIIFPLVRENYSSKKELKNIEEINMMDGK